MPLDWAGFATAVVGAESPGCDDAGLESAGLGFAAGILGNAVKGGDRPGSFGIAGTIPTCPEVGADAVDDCAGKVESGEVEIEPSVAAADADVVAVLGIWVACDDAPVVASAAEVEAAVVALAKKDASMVASGLPLGFTNVNAPSAAMLTDVCGGCLSLRPLCPSRCASR